MAYLAYHFHWSREEILSLAHSERRIWVSQIGRINEEMNRED